MPPFELFFCTAEGDLQISTNFFRVDRGLHLLECLVAEVSPAFASLEDVEAVILLLTETSMSCRL